jgi:hypothetical protein
MGLERGDGAGIERCESIELELRRVMGQERGQGRGEGCCRLGPRRDGIEGERARGGGEDGGGLVGDRFEPGEIAPPGVEEAVGEGGGAAAVDLLDDVDRQIVLLRHFEHLSTADAAEILGLSKPAAGMRYLRAMRRLRSLLDGGPDGS